MVRWIQNIITRFNQPFPEKKGFKKVVITAFWIGLFISSFLYFFRPFGFYEPRFGPGLFTLIFGLITFVTIVLFEGFTKYVLKLKKDTDDWTLGKWIVETLIVMFFISIGNYLFVLNLVNDTLSIDGFIGMILSTFVLGIFPMVFSGLLIQINAIKRNQKEAELLILDKIEETLVGNSIVNLTGQKDDQSLQFSANELLFIESRSNYVSIWLAKENNVIEEKMRNTLKHIENQLSSQLAMRCHRSFIINPDKVISVEGNAQGLRLELEGLQDIKIPVSRSYIPVIKKKLSV